MKYSLQKPIQELERFYFFINKKFGLNLSEKVVITIQSKGRKNALGWFQTNSWDNHNEKGINEINISAECLTFDNEVKYGKNPYETLAHEMAHFKELEINKKLSGNNYHTKTFKDVALSLLMNVEKSKNGSKNGFSQTSMTKEFKEMLENEFKPQKEVFEVVKCDLGKRKKGLTKMKKYTCSCGVNVRCAVELKATCNICETPFVRCEDERSK